MKAGYILLHRQLLSSETWKLKPEAFKVFITILLKVNFQPGSFFYNNQVITLKPGQTITSLENLAKESGPGISVRNVRTAINQLTKLEFLTHETTNRFTLITVVNWAKYQSIKPKATNKTTQKRHRSDTEATQKRQQYNKDNKDNKEKKGGRKEEESSSIPTPFDYLDIHKKVVGSKLSNEQKTERFHLIKNTIESDYLWLEGTRHLLAMPNKQFSESLSAFIYKVSDDHKYCNDLEDIKQYFINFCKKGIEKKMADSKNKKVIQHEYSD